MRYLITDQVIALFGEPITVSDKPMENRTIYGYQKSLQRSITMGIPPVLLYSWRSGKSTNLNIVFIDGVYFGHEVIERE